MAKLLLIVICCALAARSVAGAAPQQTQQQLQRLIAEEQSKCASGEDSMACIKERAMRFVDTVLSKDSYKLSNLEVRANGYKAAVSNEARGQSADGFIAAIENYIQGHDVTMDLPMADAQVTVSARNLANDELSLNLKLADGVVEGKGKKHRLRKMAMPIMVLILLKAITVIPMAIGILKIKALNALGLGFFSFLVSVGLAIFQLCKKIAADHHHTAHITAHGPWDGRMFNAAAEAVAPASVLEQPQQNVAAHKLAYQGYV
ncbi:uncharacterized protein LOC115622005 [Scaptodrosophila lebanonensis]|uniref:Uncharacterized protein LOC115622005 n=1 Tax=Drosophila lebanonensis TaxID=7225 RepID=A0A6J2T6T8_DROLE|nr:uncharacterized protein LOC115622005 [Scaptodrosophila lebanonensis]